MSPYKLARGRSGLGPTGGSPGRCCARPEPTGSSERERERVAAADRLLLDEADEVVVCSPSLQGSRGRDRTVHLIPNGVDVDPFRRTQPRPTDLPPGPTLVHVGTVADNRLDHDLCRALCRRTEGRAGVVLVGPLVLSAGEESRLRGSGPCRSVPGPTAASPAISSTPTCSSSPMWSAVHREPRPDQGPGAAGGRAPHRGDTDSRLPGPPGAGRGGARLVVPRRGGRGARSCAAASRARATAEGAPDVEDPGSSLPQSPGLGCRAAEATHGWWRRPCHRTSMTQRPRGGR